jgi:tetratricopeptide (TPR) repeat protein
MILSACGLSGLQDGFSRAIMNQPDPQTVREALPAFLVATDAMIEADPENISRLSTGADLYSAFAGLFPHEPERAKRLASRARNYGERGFCLTADLDCDLEKLDFQDYVVALADFDRCDVPALLSYATGWLAWANANRDDWSVAAGLPKIQAALERIVVLQEDYRQGTAHNYLAILKTLRPPSIGGRPEEARAHFERALELSDEKNLSAKTDFAEYYARLIYDRELHDRLLHEVLQSPVEAPGLTLLNTLAKRRAQLLLDSAEDYF